MEFGIGDRCYVIEDGIIRPGRVSSNKGRYYFIQFVGEFGALQATKEDVLESEEEAETALKMRKIENEPVRYI